MNIEYVPLLQVQRDLYRLPRGMQRFHEYLRTMVDSQTKDLKLPLVAMNPMGKQHVPDLLDAYLNAGAEQAAADAVVRTAAKLTHVDARFRSALVISDDLMGGWTNRYAAEYAERRGAAALVKRGWITGLLWSSETVGGALGSPATGDEPGADAIRRNAVASAETLRRIARDTVSVAIYRTAHIVQHGPAQTLGGLLQQEGWAMHQAGLTGPRLPEDEWDYSREIIDPLREAKDMRTAVECLFGDVAARSLGFTARGLSERAGLALALRDAACGP